MITSVVLVEHVYVNTDITVCLAIYKAQICKHYRALLTGLLSLVAHFTCNRYPDMSQHGV